MSFVFSEISAAANIKLKATRVAVLSALKHIHIHLKSYKKLPVNGLALFSGEKLTCIEPPNPIKDFIYKCDKVFHPELIYDLYKEYDDYGVLLVSGSDTYFYIINSDVRLVYKMNVSLQSRQKKGGQSAVRIARLAEERRFLYVKQVVEKMNEIYLNVKSLVVAGPAEMKNHVCDCDLLDYRIKPLIIHKMTIDTVDTSTIHKIMDMDLFKSNKISEDEMLCKEIVTAINMGDNKYIYGKEQIEYYLSCNNCECLYVHKNKEEYDYKNKVVVDSDDTYGKLFYQYGGIVLKCYYTLEEI